MQERQTDPSASCLLILIMSCLILPTFLLADSKCASGALMAKLGLSSGHNPAEQFPWNTQNHPKVNNENPKASIQTSELLVTFYKPINPVSKIIFAPNTHLIRLNLSSHVPFGNPKEQSLNMTIPSGISRIPECESTTGY